MIPSTLTRLPVPCIRKHPHSIIAAINNMLEFLDASLLFSTNKSNTLVLRNSILVSSDQRINDEKLFKMTHQKFDELLYLTWSIEICFSMKASLECLPIYLGTIQIDQNSMIFRLIFWCLSGLFLPHEMILCVSYLIFQGFSYRNFIISCCLN